MPPFLASLSAAHSGTGTNGTTPTLGLEHELHMIRIDDLKNGGHSIVSQLSRVEYES